MNAVSYDIRDMLVEASKSSETTFPLELIFGQNLFIGHEPAQPDETVTIFDTPAPPPGLTIDPGEAYEYGSVQIRVRARNYTDGWLMADIIKQYFLSLSRVTGTNCLYTVIYAASIPAFLEWDDNSRCKFVISIETQRIERE